MSITGQVGHIALAKQSAFGVPNTAASGYQAVKITGDSLVTNGNMIVAEGEIGSGRDVTQAVQGGFSAAGSINGNLRTRSAAAFLYGATGTITANVGPPTTDDFAVADSLPVFSIEKKVGTTGSQLLTTRMTDAMVNTLNISIASGGLATFAAGIVACGESYLGAPIATESYPASSDDLLIFHGARIRLKDSTNADTVTFASGDNDATFQSFEVVINNNVAADEYTVRPSRFLRSLTEGIRNVEANFTTVFEDYTKYQKYAYGASGATTPGYSIYMGALELTATNWQIIDADSITTTSPTGAPANPQALNIVLPKLAFGSFPVALTSGRIQVSSNARALKPVTGNIVKATVRPSGAAF